MSFLTNRKQYVFQNNVASQILNTDVGVPQSSVLGPILFLIYINDLPSTIATTTVLFADGTTSLHTGTDHNSIVSSIDLIHSEATRWFNANSLCLNNTKTCNMTFSLNRIFSNREPYLVESTKFLGFVIDCQLRWKDHVTSVANKVNKHIFMLRKVSLYVSQSTALIFYFAYIQASISYGILLWGNSVDSNRIFILQKRAIRVIYKVNRTASCKNLFIKFNILTFPSLYILQCLLYIKENLNMVNTNHHFHRYETRGGNNIRLPRINYRLSRNEPKYISSVMYNKLPHTIRNLSFNSYKKYITRLLLNKAYYSVNEFIDDDLSNLTV